MLATNSPFRQYFDLDGSPLTGGALYFGTANQNPETNPVTVYWDAAGTQPAAQPITTLNGYPVRSGNPANVYVAADYSVTARNSRGQLVFYAANSADFDVMSSASSLVSALTTRLSNTTPATDGGGMVGFDWATLYADSTVGWGIRASQSKIPALKHIPISLWAGLAAGTEATDIGPYINSAITEAAAIGAAVILPPWTMCQETAITWSSKAVSLIGDGPKWGITASTARGTCLKWTGAVGATMVSVTNGGHHARVEGIMFDANDLANTCVGFLTTGGGTTHQIHRPSLRNCQFSAYRGAAVVFGNPDTSVLDTGQMQVAEIGFCSWWGGGATATAANVFAIVLNAQNCEVLTAHTLFFDPYTAVGGGPNINHQNHIKAKAGGLNLQSIVFTRASGYDVNVVGECGLVMNHIRTEDPLLLLMAAGTPSNPVWVSNVEGRDGTAVGTELFISIAGGGGRQIHLENIRSTGHIQVAGANDNRMTTNNIAFVTPGTSAMSVTGGTPYAGKYDLRTDPGVRTVYNASAIETWRDLSAAMLYRNDRGRLRVASLQATGAGADSLNFAGIVTVTGAATSGTVTFATAEPDVNYRIIITPYSQTGAPAAGSNRVTTNFTRTVNDFTFNVEVAPGVGNSVIFSWMIFRA